METGRIAQLIEKKGIRNVNLTMFSEPERREILEKAAEIFIRLGKKSELLEILGIIDLKKHNQILKEMAENYLGTGEYRNAMLIYDKIGEKELAESIKKNLMSK